ncbi:hypothetical protein PILCRDRAFT_225362 [Piloderma croceum F 1598]|uniref:NAD-dependent protein deacetylase n=1 Tax=Piloderma croceum (strain F 1598) TaxID=765440 RepID=A0A0C3GFL4_PILCF|nr:hypothetical protein PILCRDRAFT_225362 [Piloderma croceum F 1598]
MANNKTLDESTANARGDDIASLARYMQSKTCRNVFLMLGAGISTAAGIPDFRSPDTGLYANLARLNLPYPEAVFEINFFRRHPEPFYMLAKELYPGKFRPTLTHSFVRLLASKSLLHTCFTQNIDTLERRAGVPAGKIIEAHGSFATQRCIECKRPYDDEKMKKAVKEGSIPRCENAKCKGTGKTRRNEFGEEEKERGLVKPDIVFFGEGLPDEFHRAIPTLREADLLIVMGTSLTVRPFAMLAELVREGCLRVLINLEKVGDLGDREDDIVCLGKCDEIVQELARELGWEEELQKAWEATAESVESEKVESAAAAETSTADELNKREKEHLQTEVDKLTRDVEKSLALTDNLTGGEEETTDPNSSAKQEEPAL